MFDRDDDDASNGRTAALLIGAAVSAGAFALLSNAVRHRKLSKKDRAGLKKARGDEKARKAARVLQPLGKWWSYVPAGMLLGGMVVRNGSGSERERAAGAASIVVATLISAAVNPAFDRLLPQPPSPPGKKPEQPSFPSGHTFGLGALGLTAAYVLARHEVLSPAAAAALAIAPPVIGGMAKLTEEKHWPSDVAGGLLVAMCIAGLSLAAYSYTDDVTSPAKAAVCSG